MLINIINVSKIIAKENKKTVLTNGLKIGAEGGT
jgi:hypothetical protein